MDQNGSRTTCAVFDTIGRLLVQGVLKPDVDRIAMPQEAGIYLIRTGEGHSFRFQAF